MHEGFCSLVAAFYRGNPPEVMRTLSTLLRAVVRGHRGGVPTCPGSNATN